MEAIDEFVSFVDSTQGLYLDMRRGFGAIVFDFDRVRADYIKQHPEVTPAQLDIQTMTYSVGNLGEPGSYALHECTQAEWRQRNTAFGDNPIRAGNMCLVHLFQFWNDYYRARIAAAIGVDTNDLKVDIFGDLRLLRHSIIHHRAIALPDVARCKKVHWFKPGDTIAMTRAQFLELVVFIKEALNALRPQVKT
jgi:hypothetical protein